MKFNLSIWSLLLIFVLGLILPCIMLFFVCSLSEKRTYKQNVEIERLKTIKDSTINKKYIEIRTLKKEIADLDYVLNTYTKRIDSIEKNKQKIKIVYKYKFKEIEKFNDTLIIDYWKHEFE